MKKLLLLVAFIGFGIAAIAQDRNYESTETSNVQMHELQIQKSTDEQSSKNYALLHLYRPAVFYGCGIWYYVLLDGQEVWKAKNGRRITITITKEGPITVREKEEPGASLTFDVEFGKEYYVGCYVAFEGHPQFVLQEDTEEGRSGFYKIKEKNDDTNK